MSATAAFMRDTTGISRLHWPQGFMVPETQSVSLVPGRHCGACTACCTWMNVDVEDLRKPKGVRCPHCQDGVGCSAYPAWPDVCGDWYCGWRMMPDLDDDLRPDRSGVIVVLVQRGAEHERPVGLNFLLFERQHAML